VLFFLLDHAQDLSVVREAEDVGPVAEGAIDGDLVVFDLLAGADEGDVADGGVGDVLDRVGGFGGEAADDLAGLGVGLAGVLAEERLDFGDVALGLLEVGAEGVLQFGVGGGFDEVGERIWM
jgi:hypothetical protein